MSGNKVTAIHKKLDIRERYRSEMECNFTDAQDKRTLENFAIELAKVNEVISASSLQRTFLIGYNTASCLIDFLFYHGYISEPKNFRRYSLIFKGSDDA